MHRGYCDDFGYNIDPFRPRTLRKSGRFQGGHRGTEWKFPTACSKQLRGSGFKILLIQSYFEGPSYETFKLILTSSFSPHVFVRTTPLAE
jgi:hypothetical protein